MDNMQQILGPNQYAAHSICKICKTMCKTMCKKNAKYAPYANYGTNMAQYARGGLLMLESG